MNFATDSLWVIVPIKSLSLAKSRLSSVLDPAARQRLAHAMSDDVLGALRACAMTNTLCILTDHECSDIKELAVRHKAIIVLDQQVSPTPGLNAAVAGAARLARSAGANAVAIVHADLPLLSALTAKRVFSQWQTLRTSKRALLAPSKDGGTSILVVDLSAPFNFQFGNNSYALHRAECERQGMTVATANLPTTRLDIDTPHDFLHLGVAALRGLCGPRTAAVLNERGPLDLMYTMENRV